MRSCGVAACREAAQLAYHARPVDVAGERGGEALGCTQAGWQLDAQVNLAEGFVKPEDGVTPTSPFPGGAPEITDGKLVGWSLEM